MGKSYFMKLYKKRWHTRIAMLGTLFIVAICIIFAGVFKYFKNATNPISVKKYVNCENAYLDGSYIKISSNKLYDLGVIQTETSKLFGIINLGKTTEAKFVAIKLDGCVLAIAIPPGRYKEIKAQKSGYYILRGKLFNYNNDNDCKLVEDSIEKSVKFPDYTFVQAYKGYLNYETPFESVMLYIFGGILILIYLMMLCSTKQFKKAFKIHKDALKNLVNASDSGNLGTELANIERDIKSSDTYKNRSVIITKSYIIGDSNLNVFAMPIKALRRVYKKQVKASKYTNKKVYTAVFVFAEGVTYFVSTYNRENIVDDIINYIKHNCDLQSQNNFEHGEDGNLEYQFTEDEYAKGIELFKLKYEDALYYNEIILGTVFLVFITAIFYIVSYNYNFKFYMVGIAWLICLVGFFYKYSKIYVSSKKKFRKSEGLKCKRAIDFDKKGIIFKCGEKEQFFDWYYYKSYGENEKFFYLVDNKEYILIPKRAFKNKHDKEAFANLMYKKLVEFEK